MPIVQTPPALYGPLPVKVQTGLSGLSFLFEPARAQLLAAGERQSFARLDVGSNATFHGAPGRYLLTDLEQNSLRVGVAQGTSWGEWGAQATLQARTGGILDPLIGWWHQNVVPFNDAFFSQQPRQQVQIQVLDRQNQLQQGGSATALTQLSFTAKRALRPGLALQAAVKLPVSGRRHYLDNGAVDLGVGLLAELQPQRDWAVHANVNLVRAGTTQVGTLQGGHRYLVSSLVAAERRLSTRLALVVQAEDTAFPFNRGLKHQGDRLKQMSFGTWYQANPATRWHVSISENIYPFQVTSYSPDVMISLGVVRRR